MKRRATVLTIVFVAASTSAAWSDFGGVLYAITGTTISALSAGSSFSSATRIPPAFWNALIFSTTGAERNWHCGA